MRSHSRHLPPILPKFACHDGCPFCSPSQIPPFHPSLLRYRADDHASAFSLRHFTHQLARTDLIFFYPSFLLSFLKNCLSPEIDQNVPGFFYVVCVCVCACVCVFACVGFCVFLFYLSSMVNFWFTSGTYSHIRQCHFRARFISTCRNVSHELAVHLKNA